MLVAGHDQKTREAVITLLLERGPVTAGEIGDELGISAAGVRRHLDALMASGEVDASSASSRYERRTRGRPAKRYQLTPSGRGRLRHAYDDLAGAVMRRLRDIAGEQAVRDFARDRIDAIVAGVHPIGVESEVSADQLIAAAQQVADALTSSGFSAASRRVGNGVQICQHHCPVAHVAAEFPELCEAETEAFTDVLGTHVQRLATIANGDCACTTHVPLTTPAVPTRPPLSTPTPWPASTTNSPAST